MPRVAYLEITFSALGVASAQAIKQLSQTLEIGTAPGVRSVKALRCSADAVLSREHADQFRGSRRRSVLRAVELAQIQNRLFT